MIPNTKVTKFIFSIFLFSVMNLTSGESHCQSDLPAFPGAEGFGKYVTGGRGGRVIYVTTLNDDNSPGSLRHAVNQTGPRIILFKVSGNIKLLNVLNINNGDITIAGQTAPGDGITIRDYSVRINADNVILRYLRFRLGDETNQENDAIWGRDHKNIMIDHCTMSWSTDECASFYDNENFTMQWCLLSESLKNSIHGKGAHGYGGIWGGQNASFHHNLLAHHDSRNPRLNGSRYSNQSGSELVDFRNNVIYNWGNNTVYGAEGGNYNLVNNYFKSGPATAANRYRILQPYADDGKNNQPSGVFAKFYIRGNFVAGSDANSLNNWLAVSLHSTFATYAPGITLDDLKSETIFLQPEGTTHSAEAAFQKVTEYAGASLKRDTADRRIAGEVTSGAVTYVSGGNGSTNGIIDTQSAVGGWPELHTLPPPDDTDYDGMPDTWELSNGLDKNNPNDARLTSVEGNYPNIETYINSLAASITEDQVKDGITSISHPAALSQSNIHCYYDPYSGMLKLLHAQRILRIDIYSITGALLISETVNDHQTDFCVKDLKSGIYLIRMLDEKRNSHSSKFIIR